MRIKDWHKFQHYKDRRPPWIKLYRDILDDVEWYALSGDAAKALIMLWLIASEDDGNLPDIKALAFRLRVDSKTMKALISELEHYIDSDVLADGLQDAIPETEKRESKRQRREEYSEQFSELWRIYGLKGTKKAAYAQWQKLTESERDDAASAIPDYLKETPDKQFRKDFERYLSGKVFEGVLERKATGCLNIPTNNRKATGAPSQTVVTMPTEAEYLASENVERDENGEVIF